MWLKILELLLSSGSYIYAAWQRIHQKQVIEAEIKQKQEKVDEKAIDDANDIRADPNLSDNLLLPPAQRKSKLSAVRADIFREQGRSEPDSQAGSNED